MASQLHGTAGGVKGGVAAEHREGTLDAACGAVEPPTDSAEEPEKYTKNGVDETEKRKKRFLEARRKARAERKTDRGDSASRGGYAIGLQDHPFAAESQDGVSFKLLDNAVSVDGKTCFLFAYRHKLDGPKAIVRKGKVWIHRDTGIPVQQGFTLEPLPSRVKRFTQRISYSSHHADAWYPETLEIDGVGGFLFIRKYFQTRVAFSDYFQFQPSKQ